jgi:xylan 1,4-beta-xylosidase
MYRKYLNLPNQNIEIDTSRTTGPFEWWRHSLGHGGINSLPLPDKVVRGAEKLKTRLIRTFLQEYFYIYPDHGQFDWSKLDPYMDALGRTGADIVACICIKPKVLFPELNQKIWRPNDVEEWQQVIYELVKRYSVDKKIVTYWEIGNETDIGEWGGCPYLIEDAKDYMEYYRFTIEPILKAFPSAKIGGLAIAQGEHKLLYDFIDLCHTNNVRLDFISWHLYNDDPIKHKNLVRKVKQALGKFASRPEMLITEWNKGFDAVSMEELSMMPRRAAAVAAGIFAMMEAGLDWSFYYHVWDQTFYPEEFAPFYEDLTIMLTHWNEIPHRFGLFGVYGEVRPQYFVYQMLSRMGDEQAQWHSDDPELWVRSCARQDRCAVMIANYQTDMEKSEDKLVTNVFKNLTPGHKEITVYRIDENRRWSEEEMELLPVEHREVGSAAGIDFKFPVFCPADSVTMVVLQNK